MRIVEATLGAEGLSFALVVSRFNDALVGRLEAGAVDCLLRHGAEEDDLTVVRVPGSWELPLAAHRIAEAGEVDAIVALGVLIRGGTAHFDLIAAELSKGLASASVSTGVPVTFGVVTAETLEQAVERAGTKHGNRGWDAALAAIEMANLYRGLAGR